MRRRPAVCWRLVCGAAALTASCAAAMPRPRATNWGTRRITCDTMSDTIGRTLPNRAMVFALFMQAAYDENHRKTLASIPPEHAPYTSDSA